MASTRTTTWSNSIRWMSSRRRMPNFRLLHRGRRSRQAVTQAHGYVTDHLGAEDLNATATSTSMSAGRRLWWKACAVDGWRRRDAEEFSFREIFRRPRGGETSMSRKRLSRFAEQGRHRHRGRAGHRSGVAGALPPRAANRRAVDRSRLVRDVAAEIVAAGRRRLRLRGRSRNIFRRSSHGRRGGASCTSASTC